MVFQVIKVEDPQASEIAPQATVGPAVLILALTLPIAKPERRKDAKKT